MTDRYDGLFVVLEKDQREDDVQSTIDAIRHIKGVLSVEPHIGRNFDGISTRVRLINEVHSGLIALVDKLRATK